MPDRRQIQIDYAPRQWARPLHASHRRWAVLVLHRRAGKTTAVLHHHQRAAMDDRWELARLKALLPDATEDYLAPLLKRRVYWHVMPTLRQAKEVAWDMLRQAAAPIPGIRQNASDLSIVYPTGSKIRLVGADDPDSLRGPALSGVSLDEYSQISPRVFGEILSKALGDHLGYCIWSGTLKGKDQLYQTYQSAKDSPEWYAVWRDIDASLATEKGPTIAALRQAMLDDLSLVKQGVMTQDEYDQEWYLSVDAAIQGAYYLEALGTARKEGRITRVPYDPLIPVDTDWDLGMDDLTTIWFSQSLRSGEVRLIDYYECAGLGIPQIAQALKDRRYAYGTHYAPHDISVRELGTGKSRLEVAREYGIDFTVTPRIVGGAAGLEVSEGIKAARLLMPKCWWDEEKCARGLEALRHYRSAFSRQLGQFTGVPVHDWASHGADAFRGLAVRHQAPKEQKRPAAAAPVRSWAWS